LQFAHKNSETFKRSHQYVLHCSNYL